MKTSFIISVIFGTAGLGSFVYGSMKYGLLLYYWKMSGSALKSIQDIEGRLLASPGFYSEWDQRPVDARSHRLLGAILDAARWGVWYLVSFMSQTATYTSYTKVVGHLDVKSSRLTLQDDSHFIDISGLNENYVIYEGGEPSSPLTKVKMANILDRNNNLDVDSPVYIVGHIYYHKRKESHHPYVQMKTTSVSFLGIIRKKPLYVIQLIPGISEALFVAAVEHRWNSIMALSIFSTFVSVVSLAKWWIIDIDTHSR